MRNKLFSFPSVSLENVNKFEDTMLSHARSFAHSRLQQQQEQRSENQVIENTMKGSRAKTAACLSNNRDPIEMVDWFYSGGFSEGYTYIGNKKRESYVVQCKIIDIEDEKIKISFSKNKLAYIIKQIEKFNQYSEFTEFVTYDTQDELYFHLGRLSTDKFKEPIDMVGYDVIFEFEIAPHREEGLLVLS